MVVSPLRQSQPRGPRAGAAATSSMSPSASPRVVRASAAALASPMRPRRKHRASRQRPSARATNAIVSGRIGRANGLATARKDLGRSSRGLRFVPRSIEEQIEDEFMTSSSFSEMDLDEIDIDVDSSSCASSCCASHVGDGRTESALVRILERAFDALRINAFAEYVDRQSTFFTLVSGAFLVVSAVITMLGSRGAAIAAPGSALAKVATACLCCVYGTLGVPAIVNVSCKLAALQVDIHVLTYLAVFGTVVIGSPLEGGLLLLLFAAAQRIEERLTGAAKGDLASLLKGAPKQAVLVHVNPKDSSPLYDTEKTVRVESVRPGQFAVVKAGEVVPLDGRIVHGRSLVTSENITGESLPYAKSVGDTIPAGARSVDGTIVLETLRSADESTPMRILKLTKAAQDKKPRLTLFLDSWMDIYSKVILVCTLAVSVCLPILGVPVMGTSGSLYRAAAFLTAAAPCALVMAPLAYIAAISAIARRGVIVRGGKVIDALSKCDTVALDKTGTLTEGELECMSITRLARGAANGDGLAQKEGKFGALEDRESLSLALAVSQGSTHPISLAVKKLATKISLSAQNNSAYSVSDFRMIPGNGVEAKCTRGGNGTAAETYGIQFGSVDFVSKHLSESTNRQIDALLQKSGQDKVIAVLHTKHFGNGNGASANGNSFSSSNEAEGVTSLFTFADKIRSKSALAIGDLQSPQGSNLKVMMLTGDREANAMNVAEQLGIDEVRAGLLPEDKVQYVDEMRGEMSKSGFVAFVGDGINDAPALAYADVGIAFANSTTAAAASAADAIVLKEGGDHVSSLPYIFRVARKTRRIMAQNIAIAMTSIIGTCVPSVAGFIPLWLSVSLHEGSTLLVALNSLRCLLPETDSATRRALRWVGGALILAAIAIPGVLATKALAPLYSLGAGLGGVVLLLESASAGLFAGALHSLTGPDHLAALAPLSMGRSTVSAGFLGGLWGAGHSAGQLFFGALFILLKSKLKLHLDIIENFAGVAVGLTLIAIGYVGYQEAKDFDFDTVREKGAKGRILSKFSLATFGTGFLHGLSPDAIFPVLPAITLSTKGCAFAFVLAFVVGTIGSMASYTAFIGVGSSAIAQKRPDVTRKISMGSSFLAVGLGLGLILSAAFGVDVFNVGKLMGH